MTCSRSPTRRARCDSFPFSLLGIRSIPRDVIGLYSFWTLTPRKCIYVGKTTRSIRTRLHEHFNGDRNPALQRWILQFGRHMIVIWKEVRVERLGVLEQRLIERWQPRTNTVFARTGRR